LGTADPPSTPPHRWLGPKPKGSLDAGHMIMMIMMIMINNNDNDNDNDNDNNNAFQLMMS